MKRKRGQNHYSHLYQQVQEQSDFCDVTVQVQSWSRKFHWCVLSMSPFFVKLYESKLQERQTGLIKLNIGTSNSVQTAIHFLYGQSSKIDLDNVGDILEVAEFLMIEELKALCISKMKSIKINVDNCLKILVLASRYSFYLESLSDFMLSHLPELLSTDQMLLLDKESVHFILTDRMLCYVSREDCFRFLIKWISYCPRRKSDFVELFSCLDKDDLSAEVLSTVNLDCLSENDRSMCNNLSDGSNRWCDVLIVYPPQYRSGIQRLCAYNFTTKSWFQISLKDSSYWSSDIRVTLQKPNTIVSFKHRSQKIGFYNPVSQDELEKTIEVIGDDDRSFDHLTISDKKLYCVRNFTFYEEGSNTDGSRNGVDITDFLKMQALCGFNDMLALQLLATSSRSRRQEKAASCLYVSEKEDNSVIALKPLISVRGSVQSLCVADGIDGIVCLLIPENEKMIAYAEGENCVANFDLSIYKLDRKSYICPCLKGGIYVITKSHIVQIDLHVKGSNIIANVSEILVQNKNEPSNWRNRTYPPLYEVLQDKIITVTKCKESTENQFWYQTLPERVNVLDKEEKLEIDVPEPLKYKSDIHFLQIRLPKETLRCPIDCPHCKHQDETQTRYSGYTRDYDSDEYIYYEDSDINIYYGDSSDDGYHLYSSD